MATEVAEPAVDVGRNAKEAPFLWPILSLVPGLLFFLLILMLAQHIREHYAIEEEWPMGLLLGLVLMSAIGLFKLWQARSTLLPTLSSIPFAVVLLTAIAGATALGTFVLQKMELEQLEEKYGEAGAAWIGRLCLGDVFHSLWFSGLLALLVLALVVAVLKRPFWRPKYWGFVLNHAGMVVIIAGGALGFNFGERGMLALNKGDVSNTYLSAEDSLAAKANAAAHANKAALNFHSEEKPVELPFSVKLLDAETEKYPDQWLFWVGDKARRKTLQMITLKEARAWTRIADSGLSFRASELNQDAAELRPAQHVIEIEGITEPLEVEVGQTYSVPGSKRTFRVLQFAPDFCLENENHTRSGQPNNPALLVEEPGAGKDGGALQQWLFAKMPGHGRKEGALPLTYKYLSSQHGPHVTVELKQKDSPLPGEVVFFESDEYKLPDGRRLFFDKKADEPRVYRSTIAIIENDKVVKEATIEMNSPFSYRGYSFYQSRIGKDFSGLHVVKDPGLGLAYLGMIMISLGVAYIYYVRPRLKN